MQSEGLMDKAEPETMGKMEFRMYLAPTLISHCFPDSCFPGVLWEKPLVAREFSNLAGDRGGVGGRLERLTQQVWHELKELWAEVSWCEAGE